ncbi:helix-turn-helix domain-containing protein [Paenarthrobacter sp. NPDC089322]|uniref:helix-turn-helix domain-containing protein n=1 Tax=Paenarthrobacter sp. NPDC089322 TaxID=3155065 RepID=UPI00342F6F02
MQALLRAAIRDSTFSRTELARRAGVSSSTITRIEKGDVDPTLGMAARILAAAGLQFTPRLEPLSDPQALRSARAILDSTFTPKADPESLATLKRWASKDGSPRPRSLAKEAGLAAPPGSRPGALTSTTDWNFLRLCSAVAATRKGWAVSGSPAATRIGAQEIAGPVILYVEEPERIRSIISRSGVTGQEVILLPLDETSEAGVWKDEGIVWADPIQVILDCYGMPETRQQAEELTQDWEGTND